jgi:hypothetical protein
MLKDNRYHLIRPKLRRKEIKIFSDLFNILPRTLVARDLGKEKGRFNELVHNPNEFTYSELRKLSDNCELDFNGLSMLIENEHDNDRPKDFKYKDVKMMFEEGKLQLLEDIFIYVNKSTVAKDLGKKRDTLNRLINRVERFTFRDIRSLAELCGLSLDEMLTLVKAQMDKQHNARNTG